MLIASSGRHLETVGTQNRKDLACKTRVKGSNLRSGYQISSAVCVNDGPVVSPSAGVCGCMREGARVTATVMS